MTKKAKKYDEDEDFEDSEDAESDITESDFEDPDEMEVRTIIFWFFLDHHSFHNLFLFLTTVVYQLI